jgi:hypothetical protein
MLNRLRIMLQGDPDATVLLSRRRRSRWPIAVATFALAAACVTTVWFVEFRTPATEPTVAVAPTALPAADEPLLLATPASTTSLYRFRPAPMILVALFPNLHEQAVALNRIAVFVEYAYAPHDRVLDDAALRKAITAGHVAFDDFYEGHDYKAGDLARFFSTADTDGILLNDAEKHLRASLDQVGAAPPGYGALISLPGAGDGLDAPTRAAILRHELSHGLYFTDRAYATMVTSFWQNTMTARQRDGFRRFLGSGHYDMSNDDLMRNEMQAYLIHTRNARYFAPAAAGLTDTDAESLRMAFLAAMPPSWLRDRTAP